MLEDKDRIFKNLYNDFGADLKSSKERGDWINTKDICNKGRDWIINEIKDYKYSKIKRYRIGPKVGHYTQIVWKDTKEVGVASAISKNGKVYVVARYYPAGNYLGEYPY